MIKVLEESLQKLENLQTEKKLRQDSWNILHEIVEWQLREKYQEVCTEIERYQLAKAGFAIKK